MRLSALLAAAALPLISLAANLQVSVPPTPQLPNPSTLPPSTTARLTTLSNHYSARLSAANDFQFRDVAPGSYLLEISCATHSFVPLRVDVSAGSNEAGGEKEKVQVWRTWRGNGWDSRGEEIAVVDGGRFEAWAAGGKDYYMVRQGFSPLSLLKNPMIIMAAVGGAVVLGMPYLLDNLDPETKAEMEAMQGQGPMAAVLGGGKKSGPDFNAAAWLAEKGTKGPGGGSKGVSR